MLLGYFLSLVAGTGLFIAARFFLHPLSHIPGPLFAKFSDIWLILLDNSGNRTKTIHQLHQKYGPVIRIGPNELSFSRREALKDIYGSNPVYSKGHQYGAFGKKSLFTMRIKEEHRERQKRIAHIFSPASAAQIEPIISEHVAKLLQAIGKFKSQPMDVMLWFRMLALDVTSDIFFGKNFGCLEEGKAPRILHDLDQVFPAYWIEWQFPVLHRLLKRAPSKRLHHLLTAGERFYGYGAEAFNDYVNRYGRSGNRRDLLQKMIAVSTDPAAPQPLQDKDIIIEITNLIFAGTDTTGNTFSYLFWELAKHPEWQQRLRDELRGINFDYIAAYQEVMKLPVLDAVIQETLRFWPASPASLPRLTPDGGRIIDGVKVPGNTIVSCQCYSTQRDPGIFPEPDEFRPERWLDGKGDLTAMRDMILVWGKGQRACMGRPIAMMELKIATASIMRDFSVQLGSSCTNNDMEMMDHFVLMAKGGKCILSFNNVHV